MARQPQSRPKPDPLAWIKVPDVTEAEGFAVKAWAAGTATADQQRRAFEFVVRKLARAGELPFVLDEHGGARATDFALGRTSVGMALNAIVALPAEVLRRKDEG